MFDLVYEGDGDVSSIENFSVIDLNASGSLTASDKRPKSICVKVMPKDSLVPKWLLKRFWKAEVFYYQVRIYEQNQRAVYRTHN